MTDVWIRTEPTMDGKAFMVTLSVGEDAIEHLSPERAFAYARTLLEHVSRAEYDAAVVRQMRSIIGKDQKAMLSIGQLIRDLRADRPPLDDSATKPLTFESGVNQSHKGFLTISHNDEKLGTWGVKQAKEHAFGIIEAVEVANLDAAYLRALVGLVNLDENRARQAVDDLAKYR